MPGLNLQGSENTITSSGKYEFIFLYISNVFHKMYHKLQLQVKITWTAQITTATVEEIKEEIKTNQKILLRTVEFLPLGSIFYFARLTSEAWREINLIMQNESSLKRNPHKKIILYWWKCRAWTALNSVQQHTTLPRKSGGYHTVHNIKVL